MVTGLHDGLGRRGMTAFDDIFSSHPVPNRRPHALARKEPRSGAQEPDQVRQTATRPAAVEGRHEVSGFDTILCGLLR